MTPVDATLALLAIAVGLALLAVRLQKTLPAMEDRLKRPLSVAMGAMLGTAVAFTLATGLNPLVGMQAGSWFNLMVLAMCLGFLGFIVGSLGGLWYGGMILSSTSRTTHAGAALPTAAAEPEKPRDGREPSFAAHLSQAGGGRETSTNPGGEG